MKISREFKIGLVATIAVALAIWGISFLKGINIFKSTKNYYAVYSNVKGLIENAVVYLNGYKVGNVTDIQFDNENVNKIIVEISLEQNIRLQKNTTLVIQSGSLISGTKDLNILPGEGPGYHEAGDTLLSAVEVELTDYINPIKTKVESLVISIDTLMEALNKFLDQDTRQNLQGTIANLNHATASLKKSLQPEGSLSQSLNNLSFITDNLKNSNNEIKVMLQNLAAVSDSLKESDLKTLIANADATFAKTSEMFTRMNKGEGTAGKLIVNDSLYNNLNHTMASLDSLLIDLREHPKRYVHLSVFGGKSD
jgi:phospholipid/cholesterol/gamma-HCH transport system substrate-binding protein